MPAVGDFRIVKANTANIALPGALFTLYMDGQAVPFQDAWTDAAGNADFTDIPAGIYQLRETMSPAGYAPNTHVYTVIVNCSGVSIDGSAVPFKITNTPL